MDLVEGVIQNYAWGDTNEIPRLLGRKPNGQPQAELWFGTHPAAPATLVDGRDLQAHVGQLPFLLKVLAAAQPLSLQVHPSGHQAVEGFRRENAGGIPLDSPERIYRDPYAKPEILIALGRFETLCGIAPTATSRKILATIGPAAAQLDHHLHRDGPAGAIAYILRERPSIAALVAAASGINDPRCRWLRRLELQHPNDPSAAIVLLLNYVALSAGQAIYLGPGNLHAYLHGVGVEVLASSDNVVRCGLTPKHVDVEEALRVIDPTPLESPLVIPVLDQEGAWQYPVPTTEFDVSRVEVRGSHHWVASSPELLLCTAGSLTELNTGECAVVLKGERVELIGSATIFRIRHVNRRR